MFTACRWTMATTLRQPVHSKRGRDELAPPRSRRIDHSLDRPVLSDAAGMFLTAEQQVARHADQHGQDEERVRRQGSGSREVKIVAASGLGSIR
jgi:hypothetical protein